MQIEEESLFGGNLMVFWGKMCIIEERVHLISKTRS
jgi:hypothetical protein